MATASDPASGYLHARYATSLREWGEIRRLERSGAWLLVRPIPGAGHVDAMVGYRYLMCHDWSSLRHDLDAVSGVVSAMAVIEPFAGQTEADLGRAFPDRVSPYKSSYVVDLRDPSPSRHHRAKARKARAAVRVEATRDAQVVLDDWERLYSVLRQRRGLSGIQAFSREAFREQLATPGCVAVGAYAGRECVAMTLWFVSGGVAYSHLTAADQEGYRLSATYAVNDASIELFAGEGLRWLDLGGSAGVWSDPSDGLSYFKRGWSTETRMTYLCGRIYDGATYARLSADLGQAASDFFPLYRAPSEETAPDPLTGGRSDEGR